MSLVEHHEGKARSLRLVLTRPDSRTATTRVCSPDRCRSTHCKGTTHGATSIKAQLRLQVSPIGRFRQACQQVQTKAIRCLQVQVSIGTPHGSTAHVDNDQNPFKRSKKWMPPIPTPNHQEWKTRPSEVVGFMEWMVSLASWTGLGSNAYPAEILLCVKEREPLGWHRLSANQITRSVRLLSILRICASSTIPRRLW